MYKDIKEKIENISGLIGNTPLLEIIFEYKGEERRIFAKAEYYNFTGSIKDRMALHILKKSYEDGTLKVGDKIAEATSGNTGISFAAIGAYLGHKVSIYMPNWMSTERIKIIKSFGAEVVLVSPEEGGFLGSIEMTEDLKTKNDNVFLPHQFSNKYNIEAHYQTTGPEIYKQLEKLGLNIDGFLAGVGTGGTLVGTGKYLKERNSKLKLYPMEPASSPTLSTGHKIGKHRIQGISDEFIPSIVNLNVLDEIIPVDDGDGIIMAQNLSKKLGLGLGISSGANFIGALKAQEKLGKNSVVITVFPDDNKKYLSTDLMKEEEVKDSYLSKDVKLIGLVAHTIK